MVNKIMAIANLGRIVPWIGGENDPSPDENGGWWWVGPFPPDDPNAVPVRLGRAAGLDGQPGSNGLTPEIADGYWAIGGQSTGVLAQGPAGPKGDKGDTGDTGQQGPPGSSADLTNFMVHLGKFESNDYSGDMPTQAELDAKGHALAMGLFGVNTLRTGFAIRDKLDRDWRYVDETGSAPSPTKTVSVGSQSGSVIAGNSGMLTFAVTASNIANGSYPVSVSLPAGITLSNPNISIVNGSGTLALNVSGNAVFGSSSRTVTVDGATSNSFSISIAQPVISIAVHPASSSSATVGSINLTLQVNASTTAGSGLAYQWYSNNSASNSNGTPISNANYDSYSIPGNASVGTYYYYVVVSGSHGEASAASNAATVNVSASVDNRLYDVVDNRHYDVAQVGDLYWTTENFARSTVGEFYGGSASEQFPGSGKFYTWQEASDLVNPSVANHLPSGWRLPTDAEWSSLRAASIDAAPGSPSNNNGLKASNSINGNWPSDDGTDSLGFHALAAGYRSTTYQYSGFGSSSTGTSTRAGWWTSTQDRRVFIMDGSSSSASSMNPATSSGNNYSMSIRFVKEAT